MLLDLVMFGWMSEDRESYIFLVEFGDVMCLSGVGEVVEFKNFDFLVGDKVMGMIGWSEYVFSDGFGFNKFQDGVIEEMVFCVFVLLGLIVIIGFYNFGELKEGEIFIVIGVVGFVGLMVGQFVKVDGLCVIGVVGSEEKVDWIVNEFGFDGVINYKIDDLEEKFIEFMLDKIDVFFENIGGFI